MDAGINERKAKQATRQSDFLETSSMSWYHIALNVGIYTNIFNKQTYIRLSYYDTYDSQDWVAFMSQPY